MVLSKLKAVLDIKKIKKPEKLSVLQVTCTKDRQMDIFGIGIHTTYNLQTHTESNQTKFIKQEHSLLL